MSRYQFNKVSLAGLQFTAETNTYWNCAAPHRQRIMAIIESQLKKIKFDSRIGVFNSGSLHGLDIKALIESDYRLAIVDGDESKLATSVEMQFDRSIEKLKNESKLIGKERGQLEMLAPIDISGVFSFLDQYPGAKIGKAIKSVKSTRRREFDNRFDLTISLCMLSQIVERCAQSYDSNDDAFVELIQSARSQHLDQLIHATRPGGQILLVFDFMSGMSLKGLDLIPDEHLSMVLSRALSEGNYFHGCHPVLLFQEFAKRFKEESIIADPELIPPWKWNAGDEHYAVTAITATRA